jgi:hypothetical protein
LYLQDKNAIFALIQEFHQSRHDSLVQDEFAKIENTLEYNGSRRAYREDGQVISGLLNLTRVLGGNLDNNPYQLTVEDLERGYFQAAARDSGFPNDFFVRVRLNNSRKQPVNFLLDQYFRGVRALQGLSADTQARILRKWSLNLLRF